MAVSFPTLLAFITAATVLLIIPGPTIIMVVSQALAHGRRIALASVAGVGLGDLAAASLSIAGVGTILAASASAFTVIKWLGAAYLVYIGVKLWRTPAEAISVDTRPVARDVEPKTVFRDAFMVTLLNPKGIVFFMAFVPQFIDPAGAFAPQATIFVIVFVLLGIINAWAYVMAADRARMIMRKPSVLRFAMRSGAAFLIGAGVISVFARRPAT